MWVGHATVVYPQQGHAAQWPTITKVPWAHFWMKLLVVEEIASDGSHWLLWRKRWNNRKQEKVQKTFPPLFWLLQFCLKKSFFCEESETDLKKKWKVLSNVLEPKKNLFSKVAFQTYFWFEFKRLSNSLLEIELCRDFGSERRNPWRRFIAASALEGRRAIYFCLRLCVRNVIWS